MDSVEMIDLQWLKTSFLYGKQRVRKGNRQMDSG